MNPSTVLEQQIQAHWLRLKRAQVEAEAWHKRSSAILEAVFQRQAAAIQSTWEQTRRQAEEAYQKRQSAAREGPRQRFQEIHSRFQVESSTWKWLVAGWEDPAWTNYALPTGHTVPGGTRLGQLDLQVENLVLDFPALFSFHRHGHLLIKTDQAHRTVALAMLQSAALRLIVGWPAGTSRLVLIDPVGSGANLAGLLRLPQLIAGEKACTRESETERALQDVLTHIENVIQTRLRGPYATIEAYHEGIGEVSVPYYFLVLADFPAGFNDQLWQMLMTIARKGPCAGVYILALVRTDLPMPRHFSLAEWERQATVLTPQGKGTFRWSDPDLATCPIVPDPVPPSTLLNTLLDAAGQAIQDRPVVGFPFARLSIPLRERWMGNSTRGVSVPIGVNGAGELYPFSLGVGTAQHALIAGKPGSGKTNLLHVLITQLALHYPPEELELYLLNFKDAGEFDDYARLPHLRTLADEGQQDSGLAVLNRLQEELDKRRPRFKQAGTRTLSEYREQTGHRRPRVILIVDEFQVLFGKDDHLANTAGRVLNDLVRRGPAVGLHVILSSPSPTGNFVSSRDTYRHIGLRAVFLCSATTARQTLGENGAVAQHLERPGEAYFNMAQGRQDGNIFVQIAWLPMSERRQYLETIQARSDPGDQA